MIRALLSGAKTQTRRVVKAGQVFGYGPMDRWTWSSAIATEHAARFCPYGKPGDRLWVKETWWERLDHGHGVDPNAVRYVADGEPPEAYRWRKRVSIHMPRWASRITLELTGVRVERLNDISEADAMAEGIRVRNHHRWGFAETGFDHNAPTHAFRSLWESISGEGSWSANPWVWCVSFRVVTP